VVESEPKVNPTHIGKEEKGGRKKKEKSPPPPPFNPASYQAEQIPREREGKSDYCAFPINGPQFLSSLQV